MFRSVIPSLWYLNISVPPSLSSTAFYVLCEVINCSVPHALWRFLLLTRRKFLPMVLRDTTVLRENPDQCNGCTWQHVSARVSFPKVDSQNKRKSYHIVLFTIAGLTPDENHISPIENLDNTINRLYSYLSGSEGDGETEGVSPHQRARRGHHHLQQHRHRRHHPHHGGDKWERRRSRTPPSCDSSQSSCYSQSDSELVNHHDPNLDTLRSSGTGENVYSRINDTGVYHCTFMVRTFYDGLCTVSYFSVLKCSDLEKL